MRAGIGLVSLLVCAGVIMYWFSATQIPIAKSGRQAQDEARQISGHGDDGQPAENSFETDADFGSGSRLRALVVTSVTAGGAMQTYYGLLPGDRITAIGGTSINDKSNNDDTMAKAQVAEAFQRRQPLTVERNGQTLTLPATPAQAGAPANPAADASTAAPATPAAAPRREGSALGDQLQAIQDAAGKTGQDEE